MAALAFGTSTAFAETPDVTTANCATSEMALLSVVLPKVIGSCVSGSALSFLGNDPAQVNFEGTFVSQQTTNGGMLLECVFNGWTAYTNGLRTWILGPYGILARRNDATLPYPYDQACLPPPPASGGSAGGGDSSGASSSGSSGGCQAHINTAVLNGIGSSSVNAVAISACGSNAAAIINITNPSSVSAQPTSSSVTALTSTSAPIQGTASSANLPAPSPSK